MNKIRYPAVAGFFYPGNKEELLKYIEELFNRNGPGLPHVKSSGARRVLGIIAPHAGYMYSGPIATYAYYEVAEDGLPEKVFIIGPNHTGLGTAISIYPGGVWRTPIGDVEVDYEVAEYLSNFNDLISLDESAHLHEHSVEVHLPFLQYIFYGSENKFKIIPIVMMLQNIEAIKVLGEGIVSLITMKKLNLDEILIIASTDFTHYEASHVAKEKDRHAFEAILKIDPESLVEKVYTHDISMCGYGPVGALLYVAKKLGGFNAKLLKYGNSGDITGDYNNVVSYASFKIFRQ